MVSPLAVVLAISVLAPVALAFGVEGARRIERMKLEALVFDHTDLGIIVTDACANIVAVNAAYCRTTGYPAAELLGSNPRLQRSGRHEEAFYREMWRSLETTGQWQGEIWNRRKSGEAYPVWQNISVVRDRKGRTRHFIAVASDITPVKAAQDRLDYLAHHDALTDLPNRLHFMAALDHALARAAREQARVALLFIDLDRFKAINDSFGHAVGDQLLIEVARRLLHGIRAADFVARLSGDEFVVILESIYAREEAAHVAAKLLEDLAVPVQIGGHSITPAASIGIAMFPDNGRTSSTLLTAADAAMYEAKHEGRHSFAFHRSAA